MATFQQLFTSIAKGVPLAKTAYCDTQVFAAQVIIIIPEEKCYDFFYIREKEPIFSRAPFLEMTFLAEIFLKNISLVQIFPASRKALLEICLL